MVLVVSWQFLDTLGGKGGIGGTNNSKLCFAKFLGKGNSLEKRFSAVNTCAVFGVCRLSERPNH